MKILYTNLVLVFVIATILALTGCADNYTFHYVGCVLPDGTIGVETNAGCVPASAHERKAIGADRL